VLQTASRLVIIGDGPLRAELQELINTLQLQKNVMLLGPKPNEELGMWFSAADLSCLVSSREGWPNVVMESIACGTPVVATRVGGVPEILCSAELGILVEQSVAGVATGLREGLRKDWNREAIARQAQSRGWPEVAAEVEEYLRSRVHGGSAG
jgi:teichuronic acid biosynthesis glycosyltransferase TuaC